MSCLKSFKGSEEDRTGGTAYPAMNRINYIDLGVCEYAKALEIQHFILQKVQDGEMTDTLLLLEHPHVLTMGRRAKEENIYYGRDSLKDQGINVYYINRGGDVTYHGYGQLVGYPIFDLENYGKDIKRFVLSIENAVIENLSNNHGIKAGVNEGKYTGVWVGDKKICAIGIGVKKWVSYHGFAYNINTDLDYFKYINPCGLGTDTVTSLKELTGHAVDFETEKINILNSLCRSFCVSYEKKEYRFEGGCHVIG
jgi:lipoyl(octanoyl) transferase